MDTHPRPAAAAAAASAESFAAVETSPTSESKDFYNPLTWDPAIYGIINRAYIIACENFLRLIKPYCETPIRMMVDHQLWLRGADFSGPTIDSRELVYGE